MCSVDENNSSCKETEAVYMALNVVLCILCRWIECFFNWTKSLTHGAWKQTASLRCVKCCTWRLDISRKLPGLHIDTNAEHVCEKSMSFHLRQKSFSLFIWKAYTRMHSGKKPKKCQSVENHLETQMKPYTGGKHYKCQLQTVVMWKHTWEAMLERNRTNVRYVTNHFLKEGIWKDIR